jgi:hypothetical protein
MKKGLKSLIYKNLVEEESKHLQFLFLTLFLEFGNLWVFLNANAGFFVESFKGKPKFNFLYLWFLICTSKSNEKCT